MNALRHSRYRALGGLLILACATLVVWSLVFAATPTGVLTVAFLDVGQGDAIYIETPHGNQLLIDGGKGRAVLRELGSRLSPYDRTLDAVLATHPDMDHIGGLPELFARFNIALFLESGVHDDGADAAALRNAVTDEGLTFLPARAGTTLMLDEGVALTILFPEGDVSAFESNTGSVVARLSYGGTSFLFTGDSPASIERYLAGKHGAALRSDVLKLGHHGSDTSTTEEFLGFVAPRYGIISAGCDNPYGHPHRDVLARLERFDVQALATCEHGTLVFESDGHDIRRTP